MQVVGALRDGGFGVGAGHHGVRALGWGPLGGGLWVGGMEQVYNRMVSTLLNAWVKEIPQRASAKHYNKLYRRVSVACHV